MARRGVLYAPFLLSRRALTSTSIPVALPETDLRHSHPFRHLLPLPHPCVHSLRPSLVQRLTATKPSQSPSSEQPSSPNRLPLPPELPRLPLLPLPHRQKSPRRSRCVFGAVPSGGAVNWKERADARAFAELQAWVKAHYEEAMLFVSYVEVVLVFGRVFLGAITFQNSCVLPLPQAARSRLLTRSLPLHSPRSLRQPSNPDIDTQPPCSPLLRPLPPPAVLPLPANSPGVRVGVGSARQGNRPPELSPDRQEGCHDGTGPGELCLCV